MKRAIVSRLLLSVAMIAVPSVLHAEAADDAADSADSTINSNEIIVTAQKRSERLNDVPLSISAATGDQLAAAGVNAPSDLGKIVPGFSYQPSHYGPPVYSIRGIGFFDSSLAASPTVTVYTDQVPLPYLAMAAGATLDLERVEVLKGPQGTLFGQNSTGGAINFIAAKPTNELEVGGSLEYARFGQFNLDGFISGPLSDTLGVRIAARTEQGGSWQRSVSRPDDDLGDRNFTNGRLTLDWSPSSSARFEFTASGWIDKGETQAAQFLFIAPTIPEAFGGYPLDAALVATPRAPNDSRSADWDPNADLRKDTKFYQLSLRGDIDLSDAVKLTSITAYSRLDAYQPVDPDGSYYNNFRIRTSGIIDAFSQEIRLSGELSGGKLKWMAGGNYSRDDSEESEDLLLWGSNNGVGPFRYSRIIEHNNVQAEAIAGFGSLDYQFTDTVSAQASARYTNQTRDGQSCMADSGDGAASAAFGLLSHTTFAPGSCVTLTPSFTPVGGFVTGRLDENSLSWRANLSWKPTSSAHLYVNVTKGYKAGSFATLPLVFSNQYNSVPQESVLAYEAGFKVSALNRTLQLSGATFYYDYKDKQITAYVLTAFGNLPSLITVPKSRVIGAELNLNWRPVAGLTFNGGVTYVDSKVQKKNNVSPTAYDPFAQVIDIGGLAFPNTPKWQATADVEYDFPLSGSMNGFVGSNVAYRSRTTASFGGGSDFIIPGYALVDLRAGIESSDGTWRAEIWGRNVFNKFYTVHVAHIIDTVVRNTGKPVTYGVRLSTRF